MKKSELKEGMFIETYCGSKGLVLQTDEGLAIHFQEILYEELSAYNEDLQEINRADFKYDIDKVWEPCNHYDLTKRPKDWHLIWERNTIIRRKRSAL